RINILSDQEAGLCGVVEAIDGTIESDYLNLVATHILYYTGLVGADDFAITGSVKPSPDIYAVVGTSIGTAGKHYCGIKPRITSGENIQLVIIDDKITVGISMLDRLEGVVFS